jgi:4-amino-4-deoxy-L-arabinose transferase-like glycosyltransferase
VALSLYHGQGFGSLYLNGYSVPTQALLIAGVYKVFGQSYLALRMVCAVLGALSCLVGYFLARRLFGESVARIAGILLGVYPYLVYVSALFEYPQVFFILVAGLYFLFYLRYVEAQRVTDLAIAGVLLGVAILSVPTVMLYVPLAAALVWWGARTGRYWRATLFVVAVALPVGSWTVRNYLAYDHLMLVNASSGINFWMTNNDTYYESGKNAIIVDCYAEQHHSKFCADWVAVDTRMRNSKMTEDQVRLEWERISWQKGIEFIEASPLRFAWLSVRRFLTYWSPIPDAVTTDSGSGGNARVWVAVLSYTPVLLLALAGFALTRSRWRQLLPIYGYFLVFIVAYSVFMPTTRYRLPLDFFLVIFAAVTLLRLGALWRPGEPPISAR